jgi:prolyl oligopeptidase
MQRANRFAPALVAPWLIASAALGQSLPPAAPVRPVTDDYFGTKIIDNYRYFENLKDPDVQRWMKAQADYTRQTLDSLPGYPAMLARIAELLASTPEDVESLKIVSGRYYSLRTPGGSQVPALYVRDGASGTDRLLIAPGAQPDAPNTHYSIHYYSPSPDGRYIAYGLAAGGSEESVLHIFDVMARKDLAETADRAGGDPPYWRSDNRSFFYLRRPNTTAETPATEKDRNTRDYLHVLGRAFDDDPAIVGRGISDAAISLAPADEYVEVITTAGSRYAVALVEPGTDARKRIYAAPVDAIRDGTTTWRAVAPSYDDQYIGGDAPDNYRSIEMAGDTLFWLSRKNAPRGEILRLDLARPDSKPEVVVPQGDLPIAGVYAGRGAIYWRVNDAGVSSIHRLRLVRGAQPETLRLPYAADIVNVYADPMSDAAVLSATSWLRSPGYLSVAPATGAVAVTELQPAGPYDHPDDLVAEEVKVRSWDGTLVPLSITYRRGIKLDGNNPTLLDGYGAYGASQSESYAPVLRAWYERGGISATAHVRGGGELGEAWHLAGFQATKPNTWKDFIACAQYLVDHGYTNPHQLIGSGGSAGGILIGRAIETRPDLFAAAIASVPLADMLRVETTANGASNIPEFGSVKTPAGFDALYAMSSYAHVEDGVKYPAVLVTTGINDRRVNAWIPAKFAARLQAATASGKSVLLRVDYDAGHGGIDATRRQAEVGITDVLSFALWQTGDPAFQPRP